MKLLNILLACCVLAGCGDGDPSGSYAAVGLDGRVIRTAQGLPRVLLVVDRGMAEIRTGSESADVFQAAYTAPLLTITSLKDSSETATFRVEDDLLVGTNDVSEMRLKKL